MKPTNFKPVNKTAAIVVSRGEEYNPNKKVANVHSDVPLQTVRCLKNQEDLSMRRCGRLTVIGVWAKRTNRWVMRCDCGAYTVRTAKSIKNQSNSMDACEHCRHLMYLQRHDEYRQTGKNKERRQ